MWWYLLPVVVLWLSWSITQLLHECGHAKVAEKHADNVYVDAGGPPFLLLSPAATGRLGLDRTDVWLGPFPFRGGSCGHDQFTGNDALRELYRAGYRATVPVAGGCVVLAVGFATVGAVAASGHAQAALFLSAALLTLLPALHTVENVLHRVQRRDNGVKARHGSDAWNLREIDRHEARGDAYTPQATETADVVRARRGTPVSLRH